MIPPAFDEFTVYNPVLVGGILLGIGLILFRNPVRTTILKHLTSTVTLGVGPYYEGSERQRMTFLTLEILKYINKLNNNKFQHWVVRYRDDEKEANLTEAGYRWKVDACPGTHHAEWFTYKSKYFYITHLETGHGCGERSIITIGTFTWNRLQLQELVEDARENGEEIKNRRMSLYRPNGAEWDWFCSKDRRPFDSVIMKEGLKEQLLEDVSTFLTSRKWYTDLGVPYHRGYLLHGPPGTGKSSLIRAIASEIKYDICLLNLSSEDLNDDTINVYLNSVPNKCLILLEDMDVAFKSHDCVEDKANTISSGSKITFKGLLNALDGVSSADGRIIFVTTNYVDKLDAAIIRPGRIDMKLLIDYPTDDQICNLFKRFYPEVKEGQKNEFLKSVRNVNGKVSMASLQNLFIEYRNNVDKVLENTETYLKSTVAEKDDVLHSLYI